MLDDKVLNSIIYYDDITDIINKYNINFEDIIKWLTPACKFIVSTSAIKNNVSN